MFSEDIPEKEIAQPEKSLNLQKTPQPKDKHE